MSANEKVFAGQPVNRSAKLHNKLVDSANKKDRTSPRAGVDDARSTDVVFARNDAGSDLVLGSVVGLYDFALTAVNLATDPYHLWFKAHTPDQLGLLGHQLRGYGVLLEALKYETTEAQRDFRRCQVSGVCAALVTISDVDHWGAKLVDGQTSFQSCSGTGIHAQILAKESPGSTGLMMCAVLLLTQRCLPPQLIRNVRMTADALIKDLWDTKRPCDEYVPYVIAETIVCYAPYAPYVPYVPVASYFSNAGQFDAWTGFRTTNETPWGAQSLGSDMGAAYTTDPGSFGAALGEFAIELPVTIAADGGFIQFSYGLFRDLAGDGYGPFTFKIDGVEVFSNLDGPTAAGGFTEIPVGPFALTAGAHTISFSIDSTGATALGDVARVDDVYIWGAE